MTTRYGDILARLRAATGPDRELDRDIVLWLHHREGNDAYGFFDSVNGAIKLTASINAALALAEKMLPGWYWKVEGGYGGDPRALLRLPSAGVEMDAFGPTTPLAILVVLFEALNAKEDSHARTEGEE